MEYFSKRYNIDTHTHWQFHSKLPGAPAWLKVRYIHEVLEHFIDADEEDVCYLSLFKLSDAICVYLRLHTTVLSTSSFDEKYAYISDTIRKCRWYEFYDVVEIVGEMIADDDKKVIERYQYAIEVDDDMCTDYGIDAAVKVEHYSFDIYHRKLNEFLLAVSAGYIYGEDGSIYQSDKSQSDVLAKIVSLVGESHQLEDSNHEPELSEIDQIIKQIFDSEFVDDANKQAINKCSQFYREEDYLDTLRILFPSIEALINTLLTEADAKPDEFSGLIKKVEWLENARILPPYLSNTVRLFQSSRNSIVHGDSSPPNEFLEPICTIGFRYLSKLLHVLSLRMSDNSAT